MAPLSSSVELIDWPLGQSVELDPFVRRLFSLFFFAHCFEFLAAIEMAKVAKVAQES